MPAYSRSRLPLVVMSFPVGLLFALFFARPAIADPLGEYRGWLWETGMFGGPTQLSEEYCFAGLVINFAGDLTWSTNNAGVNDVCFGRTTISSGRLTDGIPLTAGPSVESQSTRPLVSAGGNLFEMYGEDVGDGEGESRFGTLLSASSDNLQMLGAYETFAEGGNFDEFRFIDLMVKSTSSVRNQRTAADLVGTSWRVASKVHGVDPDDIDIEFAAASVRSFDLLADDICSHSVSDVFPEFSKNGDYFNAFQFDFGESFDDRYVRGGHRGATSSNCTYSIDANNYLEITRTSTDDLYPENPVVDVTRYEVSDDNQFLINAPAPAVEDSPRGLTIGYREASEIVSSAIDGTYLFYLALTEFGADGAGAQAAGLGGDRSWQEFDGFGRGKVVFDSTTVGITPDGETGTWYSCDIEMAFHQFEHEWTGTASGNTVALGQDSGPVAINAVFDDCDYRLDADGGLSVYLYIGDLEDGGFEGIVRGYVNDSGEVVALMLNQVAEDPFNLANVNEDAASILYMIAMKYSGDPAGDRDGDGLTNLEEFKMPLPVGGDYSAVFNIANLDGQGLSGLGLSLFDEFGGRQYAYRVDPSTGSEVNGVSLTPNRVRAVIPIADLNANGADEIVVLSVNAGGFYEVKIKDGQSGDLVQAMFFEAGYRPLWLRVVPDTGDDGSPDLALLGVNPDGRPRAQVRDARTGFLVSRVFFESSFAPFGFEVIEDLNSDGVAELAVIGVDDVGRVRAQVKDAVTGQLRSFVFFDRTYTPSHATGVDMDGDGQSDALAVLGKNGSGIVRAQVKDVGTASRLGIVRFQSGYKPYDLLSMPDANASGSPELALLQRNEAGNTRVQIKDAVTEQLISLTSFNGNYKPIDLALIADVDDNTYPELAFLGELGIGNFLLQIKDAVTGQPQLYVPID